MVNLPSNYIKISLKLSDRDWETVQNLTITNKAGTNEGYSQYAYDIAGATQSGIIYPSLDPSIFEVKFPNTDIKGRVVSLGSGTFNTFGGGASSGY